jgi:ADP-heptose:LPS heptosyltransferase
MKVATMRRIDRWLGAPVCWLLTTWRRLVGRRASANVEPPHSILFVKLAEQGSTVLAQGALRAAIDRVGREHVYFLLFEENRPILDVLDLVPPDNVIAIRARGLFGTILGALKAIWRMRRLGLGAAVDLEFFARASAALCYLSGARCRVGFHAFGGEASYRGDLMTHRVAFNPYLHTSQSFQSLVEALDEPAERFPIYDRPPPPLQSPSVVFQPTPAESRAMAQLLHELLGWRPQHGLILLNANASDLMPLRRWPSERYVELARRILRNDPHIRLGFTGAPDEADAIQRLVDQVGSPHCACLAGKTTMRQLFVLYTLADVLVTNDSGPAHFASLTPIDVVVLFGPETPRLFAAVSPRTHPLWAGLMCSPCINAFNDRTTACRDNVCMQRLDVDQVLDQVLDCHYGRKQISRAA